jgi:hypothetical protein
MNRAGENSAGGARRPEVGKPSSRPPRPVVETPNVLAGSGPGPDRPGPARGPVPDQDPGPGRHAPPLASDHGSEEARRVPQQDRDRARRNGPGSGWGSGPAGAGRPGEPRVGSGVPRQRVTAEGLKKEDQELPATPSNTSAALWQNSELPVYKKLNQQMSRPPASSQRWRSAHGQHLKRLPARSALFVRVTWPTGPSPAAPTATGRTSPAPIGSCSPLLSRYIPDSD